MSIDNKLHDRITLFIDTPMFSIGGVESFSINLAISLLNNDKIDVYLIESIVKPNNKTNISIEEKNKINDKVPIITLDEYFGYIQKNQHKKIITITSWNREIIKKIAQLHITNVIHKENNKVVGYVHNEASHYYDTIQLYEYLFDHIICVSQKSYDFLKNNNNNLLSKIEYKACPSSINISDFNLKRFSQANSPIVISYVGRIENAHKGVFRIPEILTLLRSYNVEFFLKIIGDGNDKEELINQLKGFEQNYSFYFANNQNEVKELLSDVDTIILLSNFEGGPLVIYEAMACGVVPIVTPVGNMTNIINNKQNGFLIQINDSAQFADTIRDLYQKREKLYTLGKNAYETIKLLGYFQADYTKYIENILTTLFNKPFFSNQEIKDDFTQKIITKNNNTFEWIKKTIPSDIISRYWLDEYIDKKNTRESFVIKEEESSVIKHLKIKQQEILIHYDKVYENMPLWWKKIGSIIRKIK